MANNTSSLMKITEFFDEKNGKNNVRIAKELKEKEFYSIKSDDLNYEKKEENKKIEIFLKENCKTEDDLNAFIQFFDYETLISATRTHSLTWIIMHFVHKYGFIQEEDSCLFKLYSDNCNETDELYFYFNEWTKISKNRYGNGVVRLSINDYVFAAINNNAEMIKFLFENVDFPLERFDLKEIVIYLLEIAASYNNIEFLEEFVPIINKNLGFNFVDFANYVCSAAAKFGRIDVLIWLKNNNYKLNNYDFRNYFGKRFLVNDESKVKHTKGYFETKSEGFWYDNFPSKNNIEVLKFLYENAGDASRTELDDFTPKVGDASSAYITASPGDAFPSERKDVMNAVLAADYDFINWCLNNKIKITVRKIQKLVCIDGKNSVEKLKYIEENIEKFSQTLLEILLDNATLVENNELKEYISGRLS